MNSNNGLKSRILREVQYRIGALLYFSGMAAWHKRIHEYTMKQLQKAAHKELPQAQQLMAKLLTYRGVDTLDKRAGIALLAIQAEKGDAQSQFLYAEAIAKSDVILTDTKANAAHWYLESAKQGHAMAALRLSKAFKNGWLGFEIDESQAEYWSQQFMQHSKNVSSES